MSDIMPHADELGVVNRDSCAPKKMCPHVPKNASMTPSTTEKCSMSSMDRDKVSVMMPSLGCRDARNPRRTVRNKRATIPSTRAAYAAFTAASSAACVTTVELAGNAVQSAAATTSRRFFSVLITSNHPNRVTSMAVPVNSSTRYQESAHSRQERNVESPRLMARRILQLFFRVDRSSSNRESATYSTTITSIAVSPGVD